MGENEKKNNKDPMKVMIASGISCVMFDLYTTRFIPSLLNRLGGLDQGVVVFLSSWDQNFLNQHFL